MRWRNPAALCRSILFGIFRPSLLLFAAHHDVVRVAKAGKEFDMIVLGAKRRGSITHLIIGSVAQRIIDAAHLPGMLAQ